MSLEYQFHPLEILNNVYNYIKTDLHAAANQSIQLEFLVTLTLFDDIFFHYLIKLIEPQTECNSTERESILPDIEQTVTSYGSTSKLPYKKSRKGSNAYFSVTEEDVKTIQTACNLSKRLYCLRNIRNAICHGCALKIVNQKIVDEEKVKNDDVVFDAYNDHKKKFVHGIGDPEFCLNLEKSEIYTTNNLLDTIHDINYKLLKMWSRWDDEVYKFNNKHIIEREEFLSEAYFFLRKQTEILGKQMDELKLPKIPIIISELDSMKGINEKKTKVLKHAIKMYVFAAQSAWKLEYLCRMLSLKFQTTDSRFLLSARNILDPRSCHIATRCGTCWDLNLNIMQRFIKLAPDEANLAIDIIVHPDGLMLRDKIMHDVACMIQVFADQQNKNLDDKTRNIGNVVAMSTLYLDFYINNKLSILINNTKLAEAYNNMIFIPDEVIFNKQCIVHYESIFTMSSRIFAALRSFIKNFSTEVEIEMNEDNDFLFLEDNCNDKLIENKTKLISPLGIIIKFFEREVILLKNNNIKNENENNEDIKSKQKILKELSYVPIKLGEMYKRIETYGDCILNETTESKVILPLIKFLDEMSLLIVAETKKLPKTGSKWQKFLRSEDENLILKKGVKADIPIFGAEKILTTIKLLFVMLARFYFYFYESSQIVNAKLRKEEKRKNELFNDKIILPINNTDLHPSNEKVLISNETIEKSYHTIEEDQNDKVPPEIMYTSLFSEDSDVCSIISETGSNTITVFNCSIDQKTNDTFYCYANALLSSLMTKKIDKIRFNLVKILQMYNKIFSIYESA